MTSFPPIEELLPHADGMLLIDRIVGAHDKTVQSETTVRADNIFYRQGHGLPAYVGFELMAQTISAYDGLRRRANGERPVMGFLLGCRKYQTARPFFAQGETLRIEATSLLGDDGMASFECRITGADGGELASAVINVYRPADPHAFLQAQI